MAEKQKEIRICYRLLVPIKGVFYASGSPDRGTGLTEEKLASYEKEIRSGLYIVEDRRYAFEHGWLYENLATTEMRDKIAAADLSVVRENGILYAGIEIQTKGFLSEKESRKLSAYAEGELQEGWGKNLSGREIDVEGGTLKFRFVPPKGCIFREQKKYEITEIAHPEYPWLHRIRALRTVRTRMGKEVQAGELGGFVQSEENLSQEGNCWIDGEAVCCEHACVIMDAQMSGHAVAKGRAAITGDACLFGHAWAEEDCRIDSGKITDHAVISGRARIIREKGYAPEVVGNGRVYGGVAGWYRIKDTVRPEEIYKNPTRDLIILENGKQTILGRERQILPPAGFILSEEEVKIVEIKLLSPLWGKIYFLDSEGQKREFDGSERMLDEMDLAPYEEAVKKTIVEMNLTDNMVMTGEIMDDFFRGSYSIREKVAFSKVSVENVGGLLYGCTTLHLTEQLEAWEVEEICDFLMGELSEGWGAWLEHYDIPVEDGIINVYFNAVLGQKFQIQGLEIKEPELEKQRDAIQEKKRKHVSCR